MTYEAFKTMYGIRLDPQQEQAVQAGSGPTLLLAVPGSGKTTVLIARIGYLILCRGMVPERILAVTYNKAAQQELEQRFARLFGPELAGRVNFRTINSLSYEILRQYAREYRHPLPQMITEPERLRLLRELWQEHHREYATEADLRGVESTVTCIKNAMMTDSELAEWELTGPEQHRANVPLYYEYTAALKQSRRMDFDDQMVFAKSILDKRPRVLQEWQDRFDCICVDEAQDVSRIQHTILSLLAQRRRELFMVGDEDQCIYAFRAACPEALTEFEKAWPGARVLLMERNYRCSGQITAAADQFIKRNFDRRDKNMVTPNDDGEPVACKGFASRDEQYVWLADAAEKAVRYRRQLAILYRDNDSALPLVDLLARRGVPYAARAVEGGFLNSRCAADLEAILRLARDPRDTNAFLQVYSKFGVAITRRDAEQAVTRADAQGIPVFSALLSCRIPDWSRDAVRELAEQFRALAGDSAGSAVLRIFDQMNYGDRMNKWEGPDPRRELLLALAQQVRTQQELLERLAQLRALTGQDSPTPDAPVILSTIHSSKGLEYDHVVIMDAADGLFPKIPLEDGHVRPADRQALAEERRLFYVGMTRARKKLTLLTYTGRHSLFADELFRPDSAERPAACRSPAASPTAKMLAMGKDYLPQTRIYHTVYGMGVIQSRQEAAVTVRFAGGTEKVLNLYVEMDKGRMVLAAFL